MDRYKHGKLPGLVGRNAIVTGSSRGLGFAIARELSFQGTNVLLVSRGKDALAAAEERLRNIGSSDIFSIPVDICDDSAVKILEQATDDFFSAIDVVVINTGGPPNGPVLLHTDDAWWEAFDKILLPSVRISRSFIPRLRAGGAIVFLVGVGAKQPVPHSVLSNAMHAAVIVLAKVLSQEASEFGIRVNSVLAGPFDTGRLHDLTQSWAVDHGLTYEEALEQRYISQVSGCARLGDASELASVVAYICSEGASFITGSCITVDGGFSNNLF